MKAWLSKNLIALGFVSLLTDVASEMMIPLLPTFLTKVLGADAMMLGWIEGAADSFASVLKLVSGRWADRLGRNRPLAIAGYVLSSAAKPLIGFAQAGWHVLVFRAIDRAGKGIRSSPRDALLASLVSKEHRGIAFSFHRAMDHAGAVIGPLIAVLLVHAWHEDLRAIFWVAAIPGALSVLVLIFGVSERAAEPEPPRPEAGSSAPLEESSSASADERHSLARFLIPLGIFAAGNSSDTFLLLKAGASGSAIGTLPLLWVGLHVVKASSSLLGGKLGDRFGFWPAIALGWVVYVAIYTGFAFTESEGATAVLFIAYGIHHGLSEGPEKALIAGIAGPKRRGAAFGWYYLTVGILTLPASVAFGWIWDHVGSRVAFLTSAGFALAALIALLILRPVPVVPALPAQRAGAAPSSR